MVNGHGGKTEKTEPTDERLGTVLQNGRYENVPEQTGSMDKTQTESDTLERMEENQDKAREPDASWREEVKGLGICEQQKEVLENSRVLDTDKNPDQPILEGTGLSRIQ